MSLRLYVDSIEKDEAIAKYEVVQDYQSQMNELMPSTVVQC